MFVVRRLPAVYCYFVAGPIAALSAFNIIGTLLIHLADSFATTPWWFLGPMSVITVWLTVWYFSQARRHRLSAQTWSMEFLMWGHLAAVLVYASFG